MEEHPFIAAARKLARRLSRKTDLSYQQALDKVARDLGCTHWSAFTSDPVAVPRDVPDIEAMMRERARLEAEEDVQAPPIGITRDAWDMPGASRPDALAGSMFVPGYNALGRGHLPAIGRSRDRYLDRIAEILIPGEAPGHFEQRGRAVLAGFLGMEAVFAERDGREASIPTMIDWIAEGMMAADRYRAADRRIGALDDGVDHIGEWIAAVLEQVSGRAGSIPVARAIGPLLDMAWNERSAILGTMDRGLLVFRNEAIRDLNA